MGNLVSIGTFLEIRLNDTLNNLNALQNLMEIGGNLNVRDNQTLISLSGLGNINPGSIDDLRIKDNFSLSECDVLSVCEYLAAPNGIVEIQNNASGCSSIEEVEEDCQYITSVDSKCDSEISIYPNPAKRTITIQSPYLILGIKLFHQAGYNILKQDCQNTTIDVTGYEPGMYFIEIETESEVVRRKIIIL